LFGDFSQRPGERRSRGPPPSFTQLHVTASVHAELLPCLCSTLSSMKMRRDGSSAGCVSSHAARDARHRDDPARPVSVSFFERDLVGFQETPDRADRCAHPTLLTQPGLHRMQGQIILRRDQCQQPSGVLILDRVLVAPPIGLAAAVPCPASDAAIHYRRDAHRKTGGCVRQLAPASMVAITRFRKSCE